jgi:hypothetical protein
MVHDRKIYQYIIIIVGMNIQFSYGAAKFLKSWGYEEELDMEVDD